jgi:hypothetical protein
VDCRNAAPGEDCMACSSSVEARMSSEVITKKLGNMVLSENTKTPKKKTTTNSSIILIEKGD